ncbi:MAG: hypothetical protein ACK5A3_25675 [Planctomyces sp.]
MYTGGGRLAAEIGSNECAVSMPISGRKIYIETVLDITSTGPTVTVVNMHDEESALLREVQSPALSPTVCRLW